MKFRRMRRRVRRRSSIVRRRRRPITRMRTKPEVKYFTFGLQNVPSVNNFPAAASNTLYSEQFVMSAILSGIVAGTGSDQRIGNRINVKMLRFHLFTRACPSATQYVIGSYNLRAIVSNTGINRSIAGTSLLNYFNSNELRNLNGFINRTTIKVFYDKIYSVRATEGPTASVYPNSWIGASRHISFSVPLNRTVEYTNGTNTVKNDSDYMNLMLLVALPGMTNAVNGTQIACTDISVRVYYTDN